MLQVGSQAPSFTLKDQNNNDRSLLDFADHWLLIWWYPSADAAGDATQGAELQEAFDRFQERDCQLAGVSFDSVDEVAAFHQEMKFSFPLLSDNEKLAGAAYDTTRNKEDRHHNFARRLSYLISPDSRIAYNYDVKDPGGHAAKVLADLEAVQR